MPLSFRQKVFAVVRKIPRGNVLTYKEVARHVGSPRAFRAVGSALKTNFDPRIPCHRVIKSDLPAPRPEVYYVYAILCGNGAIYIGQTQNLQKRWLAHREGTAADCTKRYGATKLIHYERFGSRVDAVKREKMLKTGFGRKWLKREWKAGRTRQAGGNLGNYNRGGSAQKRKILLAEGVKLI
jgi:O-6-methylguanine DNA methyltransferase